MYSELIKALRSCAEVNSLSRYKRDLMKQAADAIEELSYDLDIVNEANIALHGALSMWIPVTERLPEDDGFYMCSVENKNKFIDIFCFDVDDGEFFIKDLGDVVTHWQPLPEPPKEE